MLGKYYKEIIVCLLSFINILKSGNNNYIFKNSNIVSTQIADNLITTQDSLGNIQNNRVMPINFQNLPNDTVSHILEYLPGNDKALNYLCRIYGITEETAYNIAIKFLDYIDKQIDEKNLNIINTELDYNNDKDEYFRSLPSKILSLFFNPDHFERTANIGNIKSYEHIHKQINVLLKNYDESLHSIILTSIVSNVFSKYKNCYEENIDNPCINSKDIVKYAKEKDIEKLKFCKKYLSYMINDCPDYIGDTLILLNDTIPKLEFDCIYEHLPKKNSSNSKFFIYLFFSLICYAIILEAILTNKEIFHININNLKLIFALIPTYLFFNNTDLFNIVYTPYNLYLNLKAFKYIIEYLKWKVVILKLEEAEDKIEEVLQKNYELVFQKNQP